MNTPDLSVVIPVSLMNKPVGRIAFPASLGKMNTQKKYQNFIRDLQKKLTINGHTSSLATEILPYIIVPNS